MLHKMTCAAVMALALPTLAFAQDQTQSQTTAETAPAEDTAPAASADTVLASVGDTDITLGHVMLARAALPQQYQQIPVEMLLPGIVDQLIQQVVLAEAMEGDTPRRVELALENERRSLMASQAVAQFLETPISDADVQAAYDAKYGETESATEYNASHILVETEEEANAVVEALNGGADFAETAKEKSTGPSGPNGGELGWFSAGMMVEEFENAVMSMEKGAISDPVQTQFGWHVITLNDSREKAAPALEEVRAELETTLQQEKVKAYIDGLVEKADVDRSAVEGFDASQLNNASLLE
ncbi:peptidylprolyl isomerase [Pseudooceanicola aestuarii]|uniref:peptidylprolyl isomerase n=1 Tax=Pseudooceanicola aestuarii TaxID=2697319 RepID=UPI001EF8B36D|nr:peptidylprolyl isomerase [Pseudooceanicola aestuarii]